MSQFTQKYAIVQFFEEVPVGAEFPASSWPLHSTVADTFAIDWGGTTLANKLTELLEIHENATSITENDRLFGDNGQTRVALLQRTDSLVRLHCSVIELLEQGGWKPNDPQFAKEGFLPHATVQSQSRLNKGESVLFHALSIIDMFPNSDPYQRKVIATIRLGTRL